MQLFINLILHLKKKQRFYEEGLIAKQNFLQSSNNDLSEKERFGVSKNIFQQKIKNYVRFGKFYNINCNISLSEHKKTPE